MKETKTINLKNFIIYLFLFVTFAFPKAGITIGGIAITFQMFLLLLIVFIGLKNVRKFKKDNSTICYLYYVYAIFILMTVVLNLFTFKLFELLASVILLLSPLTILVIYDLEMEKVTKVVAISLIVVGGFSILQKIVGLEKSMIPGLTYAWGGTYSDKPIGYDSITGVALKMPSTYQNGNGSGIFCSVAILYLMKNINKKNKFLVLFSIIMGFFGVYLCGSRSVLFGFIISCFIALVVWALKIDFLHKAYNKNKFLTVSCCTTFVLLCGILLLLKNSYILTDFWDKMIVRTLNDSTGNGRVTQLKNIFSAYILSLNEPFAFLRNGMFGFPWNSKIFGEGFFGFFSTYGLITMLVFYFGLLYCSLKSCKNSYLYFAGLLTIFIDFMVDSTYSYLPYLCIFSLFYGFSCMKMDNRRTDRI